MTLPIPKPPKAEPALNELLQFEIDKTHESLFETGKSLALHLLLFSW